MQHVLLLSQTQGQLQANLHTLVLVTNSETLQRDGVLERISNF
jgi:hypothetical protein